MLKPSLTISMPGDVFEQEADQVADDVMRMPASSTGERPRLSHMVEGPTVHRVCASCAAAPDDLDSVVSRGVSGGGQQLDSGTRAFMESRFGHDFSNVRVHTDSLAAQSAQALNARAYTISRDVVFGGGQYAPHTPAGQRLLAHELTHVVQQNHSAASSPIVPVASRSAARVMRTPDAPTGDPCVDGCKYEFDVCRNTQHFPLLECLARLYSCVSGCGPKAASRFDFTVVNVEGRETVIAVNRPTDTAEFLKAFQEKGEQLIDAEFKWLSNNLIQFTADAVLKQKRNPFANITLDTLRDVSGRAYEKAVGALVARGTTEAASALVKLLYIGKKVLYVGKTAGRFASRFGGFLAWAGAALVQMLIGPLFDKTKELVKQSIEQFPEAMKKVVNETIIPQVRTSTTLFNRFMASLGAYLLQDPEEAKPKTKSKPASAPISIGEGEYAVKLEIDMTQPLSDRRRDEIIIDLANVVLGIEEVAPHLETDLSFYSELAQRTGVYAKPVATASKQAPPGGKAIATYDRPFTVTETLADEKRFDVPAGEA
jgi:hypothetical protein